VASFVATCPQAYQTFDSLKLTFCAKPHSSDTTVIQTKTGSLLAARKSLILLKAAIGIEPMNKGFADLCLTTWLRRHKQG
jgi:hypothetical protein